MTKRKLYIGEIVTFDNKKYYLHPEKTPHSCEGCVFLSSKCTKEQSQYCNEGYIFKPLSK